MILNIILICLIINIFIMLKIYYVYNEKLKLNKIDIKINDYKKLKEAGKIREKKINNLYNKYNPYDNNYNKLSNKLKQLNLHYLLEEINNDYNCEFNKYYNYYYKNYI